MVEWEDVLAHYKRLMNASGRNQTAIAKAGGLKKPNLISKLLDNHRQGPTVETFIRAVIGLGIPLSEFFRTLEQHLEHGEAGDVMVPGSFAHETRVGPTKSRELDVTSMFQEAAKLSKAMAAFLDVLGEPSASRPRVGALKRPRRRR